MTLWPVIYVQIPGPNPGHKIDLDNKRALTVWWFDNLKKAIKVLLVKNTSQPNQAAKMRHALCRSQASFLGHKRQLRPGLYLANGHWGAEQAILINCNTSCKKIKWKNKKKMAYGHFFLFFDLILRFKEVDSP
ncbi:MAG: hypothetical protein LBP92_04190 [Deltaproteobacteria bacterium]|jgi:hypothetical protein|nr:hypothetical protein [Deltaproteobacteria bacterium]